MIVSLDDLDHCRVRWFKNFENWSTFVVIPIIVQPGWCQPVRQEFMENECEVLPGVAYPGVRDNCSTLNTKTGYDDDLAKLCARVSSGFFLLTRYYY